MRKKTILLLIGLIVCLSFGFTFKASYGALSQDWIAIEDFKNDHPTGLSIDSSGNIYVAGFSDNLNKTKPDMQYYRTDIFLLKYDSLGVKQWSRTYDVQEREICTDLILDSQDNAYLVGTTSFGGPFGLLLLKYNSSGHLQWNKTWGEGIGWPFIEIDSFDNIMVGGKVGGDNTFLQKYDSSGNLLWNRTWENPAYYGVNAMTLDSSSNIFIGGSITVNQTTPPIIVLAKYNSLGEFQWNLTCQTLKSRYLRDIIVDSLDNIYISATGYGGTIDNDVMLLKYDNSGNSIWNATWKDGASFYSGLSLAIDASNNVYITGGTNGYGVSGTDILVLKYNSTGDLKWNYTHGIRELDSGSDIKIDPSENIYICGTTYSIDYSVSFVDNDAFLLKLSEAEPRQPFIPSYNLPIVILSVFGIGIAFYFKKRKSFF